MRGHLRPHCSNYWLGGRENWDTNGRDCTSPVSKLCSLCSGPAFRNVRRAKGLLWLHVILPVRHAYITTQGGISTNLSQSALEIFHHGPPRCTAISQS
jgi:hypothetical protein